MALFAGILIFGLLILASASSVVGLSLFGDQYFFIKRQVLFGLLPGLMAGYIFYKVPTAWWQKNAGLVMGFCLVLLVAVFIPGIGETYDKNARSWINILGFSFQPAEFVKLGLILFFSGYLLNRRDRIGDWNNGFVPSLTAGLIPVALLVAQPDVGTGSIVFALVVILLFFGGAKLKHLGTLALVGLVAFGAMIWLEPYRLKRVTTFLHPELDPLGIGYQINQAYLAIGSGGPLGLGLGHSRQKFHYLPEVHADSIFAIMAEEMGFVVTILFLLALYLLIRKIFLLAKNTANDYDRLLLLGIGSWITVQSFLNIGAIIGLLPLTGVPLPFVSHGGSSLMAMLAAMGIVLQINYDPKYRRASKDVVGRDFDKPYEKN